MSKPGEHERSFITYLEELVTNGDVGALASLRRGLGRPPGSIAQADRYIFRWLWEDAKPWDIDRYYLLATLFALWHQGESNNPSFTGNLGASMRMMVDKIATKTGRKREDVEKTTERRFMALLNCHHDDLPEHLRHSVSLLKAKDVPIDWVQLLNDIGRWDLESRDIQRSWAKSFWSGTQ